MSLINKMLRDLETRRHGADPRNERPIFHGLRPASATTGGRGGWRWLLALAAVGAGGVLAWRTLMPVAPLPQAPVAIQPTLPVATTVAATPMVAVTPPPAPTKPAPAAKTAEPKPKPKPAKPAEQPAAKEPPAQIAVTPTPLTPAQQAERHYREGMALARAQRVADAERELRAALAIDANHQAARLELAEQLAAGGRASDAQAVLEEGMKLAPAQGAYAVGLARLQVAQQQETQAITTLEAARTRNADDAALHGFLAALYQRAGRHPEAAKSYREALQRRPGESRWWAGLGIALEKTGNIAGAREAWLRAQTIGGLDPALAKYVRDRMAQLPSR